MKNIGLFKRFHLSIILSFLVVLIQFGLGMKNGFSKEIAVYARQVNRLEGENYTYKFPMSESEAKQVHYCYKFLFDENDQNQQRPLQILYLYQGKSSGDFNALNAAELHFRYNSKNYRIEKKAFNHLKKLQSKKTYAYKNDLLRQERVYNHKNKLKEKITYQYDNEGNLIERAFRNAKGTLTNNRLGYARRTFKYNKKNLVANEAVYTAKGSVMRKMAYRYDQHNQKIETIIRDNTGQVTERIKFKYSAKGKLLEKQGLNNFKYIKQRALYKYDEIGNRIEERTLDANNELLGDMFDVAILKRKFDQNRSIREEKRYNSQNQLKSHVWFDRYEQLLKREEYNRQQRLSLVIERIYDDYANLLEEKTYNITKKSQRKIIAEKKHYKQSKLSKQIEFDKAGQKQIAKTYVNGRLHKTSYFNKNGDLIKEK